MVDKLDLKGINFDNLISEGLSLGADLVVRILTAIILYFVGAWLIRLIKRSLKLIMEKHNVDLSLRTFLHSLVSIGLTFILVVSIIGVLGIEMSSFIALFASAGVALGMALSGSLQNFANGVFILLIKPYKVGDLIEVQGNLGIVKEIQIISTILTTGDNKTIIVPNGIMLTATITNYSKQQYRRVDWSFSIAYGDDFEKAKSVLNGLLTSDKRVLDVPDVPRVFLGAMADSTIDITVRAWVKPEDYWNVYFSMNEKVYKSFPENGLSFPFPQMDVHLVNN